MCSSALIDDNDLHSIFNYLIDNIFSFKDFLINDILVLYQSFRKCNYDNEMNDINYKIDIINEKKRNIVDLSINSNISIDKFKNIFESLDNEYKLLLEKKNNTLFNDLEIKDYLVNNFNNLIIDDFIREFVNCIKISLVNNDRHNIILDIYFNSFVNVESFSYSFVSKKNKYLCNVK